jgi:hypothetical protein
MVNSNIRPMEIISSDQAIEFHHLPMPHSTNESLASVRGRFIKSAVARSFESRVKLYFMANQGREAIDKFTKELTDKRPKDRKILFEAKFYFPESDLYRSTPDKSKGIEAGEPKRKDTSNRIKPLEDRISEAIGIDDKYFFFIWCSKQTSTPTSRPWLESPDKYCSVRLSIVNAK